jgi:glutamyl-tRNA synthetase
MKIPDNETITFHDLIRGDISIESSVLDDQVILKSDGFPTYHLAVVVDDHMMGISHVIRGEEWISSTPKHVLLYQYFEWELPVFVHGALLRNADSSKLSKRKNPVWSSWYLEEGYLAKAVLNFLALMGWSHPEEKEIFSMEEFIQVIDLHRIKTVGPIFDIKKLEWMNGEYIRMMSVSELVDVLKKFYKNAYPDDIVEKTAPIVQERIKTLKEYDEYCNFFIQKPNEFEKDLTEDKEILKKVHDVFEGISEDEWKADIIGEKLQNLATTEGISFSKFFMIVRIALAGKKVTPPLNESLEILGKEEVISRFKNFI